MIDLKPTRPLCTVFLAILSTLVLSYAAGIVVAGVVVYRALLPVVEVATW